MAAIVNYRYQTDKNELMFWEYLFQRGFGVCNIEVAAMQDEQLMEVLQHCVKDDRLYLPVYMRYMYRIVKERQK